MNLLYIPKGTSNLHNFFYTIVIILPILLRYRSPSFTAEEMLSLIDCCEHYKFILFNKTTTGVVNKAKDAAWKRITKAYNQCGHRVRDLDILRNKWDNMKRLGKKVYRASLDNQDDYKDDLVTKRMTEMILEAEKYPQHDLIEDNTEALGSMYLHLKFLSISSDRTLRKCMNK